MTERRMLECIAEISESQYQETGDDWWLDLHQNVMDKLEEPYP